MIYLDNNATTPLDPRVLEAMMPFLTQFQANASSTHKQGAHIAKIVENAREKVSSLINAHSSELIFTSGATEAINLAIKGAVLSRQVKGNHVITIKTEHKAVLDTCKYLEAIGFEVTYLPVEPDGLLNLNLLEKNIRPDTALIAVMLVNNETGVIQPVAEIADMAHNTGTLIMCDATQGVGKMPVDVNMLDIDLMAFSAHKLHGPKGIGSLYIKKGISIEPQIHGGGHELGWRSGTLNVPGIIGFGEAAIIAQQEIDTNVIRIMELRDQLETDLLLIPGSYINGNTDFRLQNVTNITFPGLDANILIDQLDDIAISNGSACTAAIIEPSHVLKAMNLSNDEAFGAIRFSLSKFNTHYEIAQAVGKISHLIKSLSNSKFLPKIA